MFLKRAFYDPLFKCASKSTLFFTLMSSFVSAVIAGFLKLSFVILLLHYIEIHTAIC